MKLVHEIGTHNWYTKLVHKAGTKNGTQNWYTKIGTMNVKCFN